MNFQDLKTVERASFYMDVAVNAGKKSAESARLAKTKDKVAKSKNIEAEKVHAMGWSVMSSLKKIIISFPNLDNLPEFYQEVIDTVLDAKDIKVALSTLQFTSNKVKEFTNIYVSKIKKSQKSFDANNHRRSYMGRLGSLLKRIDESLQYLEHARKTMKNLPAVKTGLDTICLCGYPNVGKSTLLNKLSGAKSKINSYAFTTTGILIGYMNTQYKKVQLIDTPGVLNRVNKENVVERQAFLAVKYLAKVCVFVIDLTQSSGYSVEKQYKLYQDIKKRFPYDFILYISKTDITEKSDLDEFVKNHTKDDIVTDSEILKEKMIEYLEI